MNATSLPMLYPDVFLWHQIMMGTKALNHDEGSSVPLKYPVAIYIGIPKRTLDTTLLTLTNIFSFAHVFFISSINNEHIHKSFLRRLHLLFLFYYFLDIRKALVLVDHLSFNWFLKFSLILFRVGLFWTVHGLGVGQKSPLSKFCHIGPDTVIPYLKKSRKIYESRDTTLEFCPHQHF